MPLVTAGPHLQALVCLLLVKSLHLGLLLRRVDSDFWYFGHSHFHRVEVHQALKQSSELVLGLERCAISLVIEFQEKALGAIELDPLIHCLTEVLPRLIQVFDTQLLQWMTVRAPPRLHAFLKHGPFMHSGIINF